MKKMSKNESVCKEALQVLIITSELEEAEALSSIVKKFGYKAVFSSNQRQAILDMESQNFLMVFCDNRFHKSEHFELEKLINSNSPSTKFVIMADLEQLKEMRSSRKLLASELLFKPFQEEEVEAHIKKAAALHNAKKKEEFHLRELEIDKSRYTGEIDALNKICLGIIQMDLQSLLDLILSEIIKITNADAGSIYIVEEEDNKFPNPQNVSDFSPWSLRFKSSKNMSRQQTLKDYSLEVTNNSMAGYCVIKGDILNIPDAYNIPANYPFNFNRSFDEQMKYRTRSVLTIPLKNHLNEIIGVVQVINRKRIPEFKLTDVSSFDKMVVPFDEEQEKTVSLFSSHAGMALFNTRIIEDLENASTVISDQNKEVLNTREVTFIALAKLAESRDPETGMHLERIGHYTRILAEKLKEEGEFGGIVDDEFIETIAKSSTLHDIGKVGIADNILLKPGKLTHEEFEIMKQHATIGGDSIKESEKRMKVKSFLEMGRDIAYYHHEKFDGSGYPSKLTGNDIPTAARIMAVADVYDALTSKRVYKKAFDEDYASKIIIEGKGSHFDPVVVEAFKKCSEEFLKTRKIYVDTESGT